MDEELLYRPEIYIADDDEDDVYFVKSAVKELDSKIELKHFSDGKKLLQGLKSSVNALPKLILLDLNMPILDGKETLKLIRDNDNFRDLPIVVLSTSNYENERKLCYEYGANSYFTKPSDFPKYLEIMRNIKTKWIDSVMA
jgi:CheY-like chemotaxis protein